MSGYREHSFEPNRWEPQGPPLRPYNWVQWVGLGFFLLGLAAFLAYFGGRLGLMPQLLDSPTPVTTFMLFGVVLLNSRRAPVNPEDREKIRRRTYIALGVALLAAIAGAAIAIFLHSQGA